jgi:hypothetical protein
MTSAVRSSRTPLLLVLPLALATLAGCGQVEDAARGAASDAAGSVSSSVRSAAVAEATRLVCAQTSGTGVLADATLTADELAALRSLVATARSAGLPAEVSEPLDRIAASTDEATTGKALTELKERCAAVPTG